MADDPAAALEPAGLATPSPADVAPEPLEAPEPAATALGDGAGITPVNGQITDAVTQANLTVLGEAPALALAVACQMLAQATGLAFLNATQQQQQANMIAQAATAAAVARILGREGSTAAPAATPGT